MGILDGGPVWDALVVRCARASRARLLAVALLALSPAVAFAQTADVEVVPFALTDGPTAPYGVPLTVTVAVLNEAGPDVAGEVAVTTTLPGCIASSNAASRGCRNDPAGVPVCELGGIEAGETVEFSLLLATAGCLTGEPVSFTVAASTDSRDPQPANNTATLNLAFDPKPPSVSDIGLTLVASPGPASVGEPLVYRATAENRGPNTADGLLLSVSLGTTVKFVTATAPDPSGVAQRRALSCTLVAELATCRLPVIAVNDDAEIAVTLATLGAGIVSTRLAIRSTGDFDPTPGDREVRGDTTVRAAVAGDFDGDRCVTTADVALFAQAFRARRYDAQMDLNADGILNTLDIARLRAVFGSGDGPTCGQPGRTSR